MELVHLLLLLLVLLVLPLFLVVVLVLDFAIHFIIIFIIILFLFILFLFYLYLIILFNQFNYISYYFFISNLSIIFGVIYPIIVIYSYCKFCFFYGYFMVTDLVVT